MSYPDIPESMPNFDDDQKSSPGSTFVEGVGDEVTCTFTSFLLLLTPFLLFLYQNRERALQSIHPASLRIVEEARRRLGLDNNHPNSNQDRDDRSQQTPDDSTPTSEGPSPQRLYNQDRNCPICFAEARFAVQTNCGHLFCGQCLIAYWRFGNWLGPVKCPVCRVSVSILLPRFAEADPNAEGRAEMVSQIDDYNRRFSGEPRPWMDYIRDLPVLVPYIISQIFSMSGLLWMFRIRVIVCLLAAAVYILSPLDIIPEAVFGFIGILDDIFVLIMILIYVTFAYRQFAANQ